MIGLQFEKLASAFTRAEKRMRHFRMVIMHYFPPLHGIYCEKSGKFRRFHRKK